MLLLNTVYPERNAGWWEGGGGVGVNSGDNISTKRKNMRRFSTNMTYTLVDLLVRIHQKILVKHSIEKKRKIRNSFGKNFFLRNEA